MLSAPLGVGAHEVKRIAIRLGETSPPDADDALQKLLAMTLRLKCKFFVDGVPILRAFLLKKAERPFPDLGGLLLESRHHTRRQRSFVEQRGPFPNARASFRHDSIVRFHNGAVKLVLKISIDGLPARRQTRCRVSTSRTVASGFNPPKIIRRVTKGECVK